MDLLIWLLPALVVAVVAVVYFVFGSFVFGAGYQPAPRSVVTSMLDLGEVGPTDTLYDLGAGTGAIVFRAVRERGARAVAVEVEPIRIGYLRLRRWWGGSPERVEVRWGNLFDQDLGAATVVAVFLWPDAMRRLRPVFERRLKPGTRVVSHWHPVPGWSPEKVDAPNRVYFYRWSGGSPPPG
ncbi:MAG TPA: class I SAM-dependent methyltransferase [Thermoplasmata archaeon]